MSGGNISGWQAAMMALPDLASPKGRKASTEKKAIRKKSQTGPAEPTGNVKPTKQGDTAAFSDKKENTKNAAADTTNIDEKRPVSPRPTKRMDDKTAPKDVKGEEKIATAKKRSSIVKREVGADSADRMVDGAKANENAKGEGKEKIVSARRTRSVSRQLEADHTETSDANKRDTKKISVPMEETRVKRRLSDHKEEIRQKVPTIRKRKLEDASVSADKTPTKQTAIKKKMSIPNETILEDEDILDDEKKSNKKTVIKKKVLTLSKAKLDEEISDEMRKPAKTLIKKEVIIPDQVLFSDEELSDEEEKKPKVMRPVPGVTNPSRPTTFYHYTRSGKERDTMDYANKLRSMTAMLKRKRRR
ncbi:hypothetical protein SLS58_007181 [Diplodia intermedia]|uniref:Uncharacterized protein n=1 Tax=Diplodia intermedia TaxID=856260 RepID=A0ABR3TL47_9PEZI